MAHGDTALSSAQTCSGGSAVDSHDREASSVARTRAQSKQSHLRVTAQVVGGVYSRVLKGQGYSAKTSGRRPTDTLYGLMPPRGRIDNHSPNCQPEIPAVTDCCDLKGFHTVCRIKAATILNS